MMKGFKSLYPLGLISFLVVMIISSSTVLAGDGTVTILATSDIHGSLMSFGDYDDDTGYYSGGFLPLSERLIEKKIQYASLGHGVLTLDGGDYTQGTYVTYAWKGFAELALLGALYDATTIGNHELDWGPDALYGVIGNAYTSQVSIPPLLCSNITDWGGHALEGFHGTYILDYMTTTVGNVHVGLFGGMTSGAAALAQPAPLVFSDLSTPAGIGGILNTAGTLAYMGVDLVVYISHSGISYDVALASYAAANGVKLDVILSGHDHTPNPQIYQVYNTRIMQVGAYGTYLGRLSLTVAGGAVTSADYDLEAINADNTNISGEPTPNVDPVAWATLVATYGQFVNATYMAAQIGQAYPSGWNEPTTSGVTWYDFSGGQEQDTMGVTYPWQTYGMPSIYDQMLTTLYHSPPPYNDADPWMQIAAHTQADLFDTAYAESNFGNLVTDGMHLRAALADLGDDEILLKGLPGSPGDEVTDFAVDAAGTFRSDIYADDNGITLSDAYQALPLGIGLKSFDLINGTPPDPTNPEYAPGYDLFRFYMKGSDLKTAIEFGVMAQDLGQTSFFLHWAGLTFDYDMSQDRLHRVTNLKLAGNDVDSTLVYKGVTTSYVASSFLVLSSLLQAALNAGAITQEEYDTLVGMKIYMDYLATVPVTNILYMYAASPALYCGKAWVVFCDKIMWPYWYGGLNGIVWAKNPFTGANIYGAAQGRMNDITPDSYRIDLTDKSTHFAGPAVISHLMGVKSGEPGYKAYYDLNHDGVIDGKDLNKWSKLVK
ncbi:bifunctional metallophosphatase/5'-nucleotidase [candidate division CSSED10-310 bacterium]|uniref:Bifunctional metallophosphatase/5'-nucleotidase n=1 Tax=candidate division CSSED10-310 bacterium TaxID=2855610 RepID=A0ABV6Z538_UNCC1